MNPRSTWVCGSVNVTRISIDADILTISMRKKSLDIGSRRYLFVRFVRGPTGKIPQPPPEATVGSILSPLNFGIFWQACPRGVAVSSDTVTGTPPLRLRGRYRCPEVRLSFFVIIAHNSRQSLSTRASFASVNRYRNDRIEIKPDSE